MKKKRQRKGVVKTTSIIHKPVEPYASLTDAASNDDKKWFEAHPGSDEYVRDYRAGEFREQVPPTDHRVLVRQLRTDMRIRIVVSPEDMQRMEQGIRITSPHEIKMRQWIAEWEAAHGNHS